MRTSAKLRPDTAEDGHLHFMSAEGKGEEERGEEMTLEEMVAKIDLTNPQYMGWFMAWKQVDGTKEGLFALFGKEYFINKN